MIKQKVKKTCVDSDYYVSEDSDTELWYVVIKIARRYNEKLREWRYNVPFNSIICDVF